MKTGLVMEGGAMRGMFTAGVIDIMMENGIRFNGAIGVSAGAAFGCNYKSNQPGRAIRYNTTYCNDPRYCSIRSLIRTGDLFGRDFCYRVIPYELDPFDIETFKSSRMEFYVVCTDVETGKAVYHKCVGEDNDFEWMRASASMPLVSRIVEVDGLRLLDGGMSDSVPLKYFEDIGYERNVVVLTRPKGYMKKPNRLMPYIRIAMRKYPNIVKTMAMRHETYNTQLSYIWRREKENAALVICPDEALPIGRIEHDPKRLRAVYEIGRKKAESLLDKIKEFTEA